MSFWNAFKSELNTDFVKPFKRGLPKSVGGFFSDVATVLSMNAGGLISEGADFLKGSEAIKPVVKIAKPIINFYKVNPLKRITGTILGAGAIAGGGLNLLPPIASNIYHGSKITAQVLTGKKKLTPQNELKIIKTVGSLAGIGLTTGAGIAIFKHEKNKKIKNIVQKIIPKTIIPTQQIIKEKPLGEKSSPMMPLTENINKKRVYKHRRATKQQRVRQYVKGNIYNHLTGQKITNKRYINEDILIQ